MLLPLSIITTDVTLPPVIILLKFSFWLLPDTATPSSFTYPVPPLIILILLLLDIIPDAVILGLDTLSLVPAIYPNPGEIIFNLFIRPLTSISGSINARGGSTVSDVELL